MTALVLLAAVAVGQYLRREQPGGVATSPTETPSPSASATPSTTPSASPTASAKSLPPATPIPLPAAAQLSAPSKDVVWTIVAQSALFRSSDRGTTWEQRPLPAGLVNAEIAFVSDREGWISSVGPPATQCQSQSITLWHTADGGTTWGRLAPTGIADAQCKARLSFTDASHGFLVGSDPNHVPVIYRTADGGGTWTASRTLADPPGATTGPGGFELQPERVRAFGSTLLVPVLGPTARYVYRSTDGGATWTYAATAPNPQSPLAFLTDTRWLLLAIPGPSQMSTDAGKTWQPFQTDYQQAAPIIPELVFGDASVGYATIPSRGSIQRTVDGGAHWTAIKTPGT